MLKLAKKSTDDVFVYLSVPFVSLLKLDCWFCGVLQKPVPYEEAWEEYDAYYSPNFMDPGPGQFP